VDIDTRAADVQARTPDLRDTERRRDDQGQFPLYSLGITTEHCKELLNRLTPVETTYHSRIEAPAYVHPSINVASLAPSHDGQAAHYSQPTPLAAHAVMSEHEEEDVARAVRAVRAAYDALQALRSSHHSKIPSSLYNAGAALNRVLCNLELLTGSTETLSIFRVYTVKEASNSAGTSLSDAIVHDMEEAATCFGTMKPAGPSKTPDDLDKQKCRNIKEMVDQYETIVSMVLSKHKECVLNELTLCVCLVDLL
jgi:hypothetical protein